MTRTFPDDVDTILSEIFEIDAEPNAQSQVMQGMRVPLHKKLGLGPFAEQFTRPRIQCSRGIMYNNPYYTTVRLYVIQPPSQIPFHQMARREPLYYDLTLDCPGRKGLWISRYDDNIEDDGAATAPVARVEQIDALLDAILALPDSRELPELCTLHIAKLSQIALTGQLEEYGKEHGFAYCIGHTSQEAFLSFRIGMRKLANHLIMPVDELSALTEEVPQLIDSLQTFAELGVWFQANNQHWIGQQSDWIKPGKQVDPELT